VFIRIVDEGLERLVRAEVPLSDDVGDVNFDVPTATWSAALSRPTVNLFLYDVARSDHPNPPMRRVDENGTRQRRAPQPMVQLSYLISAWAGNPRDEHQLLGEVISRFAGLDTLSPDYLPQPFSSSVYLSLVAEDVERTRSIWSGAGGTLKAGFALQVAVAADTFGWVQEPPLVTGIEGRSTRPGASPTRAEG
jgi:Pvc16 N-terminal domain